MMLILLACTGKEVAPDALAGTVTTETGEVAELVSATAFGVNSGGTAAILVSPNPDTSCEDAATFIDGGDEDFNPEAVSGEGVCNLFVRLDEYTGEEVTLSGEDLAASLSLNCAMDSGEWVFEERSYEGYFYSGPFWVGSPEAYTLTLSGGDEADFALTVEMDSYTGRFPYDADEPDADPATGDVHGAVTATWCEEIAPVLN